MILATLTLNEYLDTAASSNPTPGGGAIAAITGASAVALVEMLANLTIGKAGYEDVQEEMLKISKRLPNLRRRLLSLADADAAAFDDFMVALRLPKETEEETAYRKEQIQICYKKAADVPFEIGEVAFQLFKDAETVIRYGNTNATTDGMIGVINARAAVKAAFLNVKINLRGIKDQDYVAELRERMARIESQVDQEESRLLALGNID